MANGRYPDDLIVTRDDFNCVDIEKLIEEAKKKDVDYYHDIFSKNAKDFIEQGKVKEGKVLWLLSDACSPILKPESANGPYVPFFSGGGKRSPLPEDFTDNDIAFFESIIPEIVDYHLRARIADICWFVGNPRKPEIALIAIDSYLQYRFENEEHAHDCKAPYERAIFLCSIHREISEDRSNQIHGYLIETLQKNVGISGTVTIVSDLLLKHGIGDKTEIVYETLLETAKSSRFDPQRKILENALAVINRKKKTDNRIYDIHARIAESYAEQAASSPSMFASDMYHKAILEFQKIPRRIRDTYASTKRLNELDDLKEDANIQASTEMAPISSPPINITDIVNASIKQVKGIEFPYVLLALSNIIETQKIQKYREEAIKNIRESILTSLFQTTQYSRDGRVTAKSPGADIGDESNPDNETVIWHNMMQNYHFYISLCVQAAIIPALEVINAEHRISLDMMYGMCRVSTVVPRDRILVWAKGIYAGFESDFIVAVHLLTPQIEHYVRVQMKLRGIRTTTTDQNGIETENGLGTLLANNDINQVLDVDTLFELKAIFTDSFGFNLRNDIAHGLVDSNLSHTFSAVYAWWFCLKLIVTHIMIPEQAE